MNVSLKNYYEPTLSPTCSSTSTSSSNVNVSDEFAPLLLSHPVRVTTLSPSQCSISDSTQGRLVGVEQPRQSILSWAPTYLFFPSPLFVSRNRTRHRYPSSTDHVVVVDHSISTLLALAAPKPQTTPRTETGASADPSHPFFPCLAHRDLAAPGLATSVLPHWIDAIAPERNKDRPTTASSHTFPTPALLFPPPSSRPTPKRKGSKKILDPDPLHITTKRDLSHPSPPLPPLFPSVDRYTTPHHFTLHTHNTPPVLPSPTPTPTPLSQLLNNRHGLPTRHAYTFGTRRRPARLPLDARPCSRTRTRSVPPHRHHRHELLPRVVKR